MEADNLEHSRRMMAQSVEAATGQMIYFQGEEKRGVNETNKQGSRI